MEKKVKVWEKINQLKGTDESYNGIRDWAYMNRICPIIMEDGLELDEGEYPKQLEDIAKKCCEDFSKCSIECLDCYLNSEV